MKNEHEQNNKNMKEILPEVEDQPINIFTSAVPKVNFRLGQKVLVIKTDDKGRNHILQRGIIKVLTTCGAYILNVKEDKHHIAPEWFAFFSRRIQILPD